MAAVLEDGGGGGFGDGYGGWGGALGGRPASAQMGGPGVGPEVGDLGGADLLASRTPNKLRQRVLDLFQAPANRDYLRTLFRERAPPGPLRAFALETLDEAVYDYARSSGGLAGDLVYSDPIAQRGASRVALNFWAEVRRLNLAFFTERMAFLRDQAPLITGQTQDGEWDDNESYHYRMFVADSLRPPGLENLNGIGPLWGIRELEYEPAARGGRTPCAPDAPPPFPGEGNPLAPPSYVTAWEKERGRGEVRAPAREGFVGRPPPVEARLARDVAGARAPAPPLNYQGVPTPLAQDTREFAGIAMDPGIDPDDWGWSVGDPGRTAQEALAQYWGEETVESAVAQRGDTAGTTQDAEAYIERYGRGGDWRENGGTRFMRYPEIPFWQNLSRGREYDRDIEETLGRGSREQDTQVRRWNLDVMRNRRGEETRRYRWRD